MKRIALYCGIATALVVSCSTQEKDFQTPGQENERFYATIEQPGGEGTRVYATEDLLLRWTADDRVSIFNKSTYNQQYKFTGETGDNAGGFRKVATDEFVTGNSISDVVSVYPYREGTKISESEVITVTLPAEQHYAEKTFGLGANTMVSVTEDNFLQYKNVGGFLVFKLYGDDVSISSITLRGNNGEQISGKASVIMPVNGIPSVEMSETAGQEITLVCDTPVKIGSTAETATTFWLVVPPTVFSKGFNLTVRDNKNDVFEKATSKNFVISRNILEKMSPLKTEFSVPVTGVSLDKTSLSMVIGDTQTLYATVTPSNATDNTVIWSTSNASVATVTSSGVVAAKAVGNATITAMAGDKYATCTVTVKHSTSDGENEDVGFEDWN